MKSWTTCASAALAGALALTLAGAHAAAAAGACVTVPDWWYAEHATVSMSVGGKAPVVLQGADVLQAYPRASLTQKYGGQVLLSCNWPVESEQASCLVTRDTERKVGLGKAAARLVEPRSHDLFRGRGDYVVSVTFAVDDSLPASVPCGQEHAAKPDA
jgi:hypothetical protein